ncbi:S8 family serine peptidase [Alteromonas ponticola]|uniref:S8 family serine peptidase n=1 Tax=Alteromonas aquimaris TaxID=2998417 RepID=A0ABT3P323_9ALTE|nr:S8 family serine peptidase [Alteromonas aquimaris]MCW8107169.1 S8 family serine peptidase [Alteromonas aquimaris]
MKRTHKTFSAIAVSLVLSGQAAAAAMIGPKLNEQLKSNTGPFKVIVSFDEHQKMAPVLEGLNIPYLALQTMPMVGAALTKEQLNSLAAHPNVTSIYADTTLEYYNYNSGEITGGHFVQDNYNVTGKGVTVAVLDSGVDSTHPDLTYGDTTIENVKIVGDLDLAGGRNAFIEGTPNSDTSSGHGTHVAGTVAGSGAASANDERRANYHDGIAPDATLIGLGAGEGLSILYALLGFDYAIANQERFDIDIITNSWGGGDGAEFDPNNPINKASFQAYKNGMVVTFAASNSGPDEDTLNQYAIAPWVINVAAGTPTRDLADFSSRGVAGHQYKLPDITAPGESITSTRAVNTALGALGPVTDPAHPEYYAYYHTISGTSMATPFVAGVAALLLEVNPQLSPDQIEQIIKDTADPMDYAPHEVGAGHINVKAAVELASTVAGERAEFMKGDTLWARSGEWEEVDDANGKLLFEGKWRARDSEQALNDSAMHSKYANAAVLASIRGDRVRLNFIVKDNRTSSIEVLSDGRSVGYATIYSETASKSNHERVSVVFDDLGSGLHDIQIRMLDKNMMFDGLDVDGSLVDIGVTFEKNPFSFSGTMGASAENIEVHEYPLELGEKDVSLSATLAWSSVADLDFYLIDPAGNTVASSASLENPEGLQFWVEQPGTYTLQVTGYISAATPYTIDGEITSQTN